MRDEIVPLLDKHIERCSSLPFDFAQMDCARFANEWVKLSASKECLPDMPWKSESEARLWLLKSSPYGICSVVDVHLSRIPLVLAKVGDIVAASAPAGDDGWTPLGICLGRYSAFLTPERAPIRLRTLSCLYAWDLGI